MKIKNVVPSRMRFCLTAAFLLFKVHSGFGQARVVQEYLVPKGQNVEQVYPLGDSLFVTYSKWNNALLANEIAAGWVNQGKLSSVFFADLQKADLIGIGKIGHDAYVYVQDPISKSDGIRVLTLMQNGRRALSDPIKLGFKSDFTYAHEGINFVGHQTGRDTLYLVRVHGLDVTRKTIPFPKTMAANVDWTSTLVTALFKTSKYLTFAFEKRNQVYVWRIDPTTYASAEFHINADPANLSKIAVGDSCVYRVAVYTNEARVEVYGLDNQAIKLTKPFNLVSPPFTIFQRSEKKIRKTEKFVPDLSMAGPSIGIGVFPDHLMNAVMITSAVSVYRPKLFGGEYKIGNYRWRQNDFDTDVRHFYLRESRDHTSITAMDKEPMLFSERVDEYEFTTFLKKEVPASIVGIRQEVFDKVYIYEKPEKLVQIRFKEN